jgi:metal-dependent amidase/aminoacylase/carboxypeptidase family protein
VAHACGHDVHTAVTLGAGLYLAHHWPDAAQGLRLIFQPAEETLPGGALEVIAEGGLDGVERLFGLHCDPKLGVGEVGLRVGPITSASDMAVIELFGPGGHTARPERTVDMVALAARVVAELPDRVHTRLGREAELRDLVDGSGATVALRYTKGVPPVTNDAAAIDDVRRGVVGVLGEQAITEAIQSWGGDDFAWFSRRVPSAYVRLGTHDPADGGPRLDLHAGHFDVDERAIAVGVRVLVSAVEQHLASRR